MLFSCKRCVASAVETSVKFLEVQGTKSVCCVQDDNLSGMIFRRGSDRITGLRIMF